jgi:hypothetical protein
VSEDHPLPPVRLWWWLEDNIPGLLPAERVFFRAYHSVSHPAATFYDVRHRLQRPRIGGLVRDCRNQVHTVTGFGDVKDDLILDDGYRCSWTHCCDPVKKEGERQ